MSKDPFRVVIDNYAGLLSEDQEGSMTEVFEYYAERSLEQNINFGQFRMDIATGYFFFSGFQQTYSSFLSLYRKGILRSVEEQSWGTHAPIRVVMGQTTSRFTKSILLALIIDRVNSWNSEEISLLKDLIDDNLIEFRVFLDRTFHTKYYAFYLEGTTPDDIWCGSANFSYSGFEKNIELCAPIAVNSQTRSLYRRWFDNLFERSTTDIDVLEALERVSKDDYVFTPPGPFFAKLIKVLNKEYLLDAISEGDDVLMLEYQDLSYFIVMERLQRYGGYILSNSVGTGKSYVAAKVMSSYARYKSGKRCLLIVPPRVRNEWESYLSRFGISDVTDVLSIGQLQKPPYGESEENFFDHRDFSNKYSIIVVDEAHHFRNPSNRRHNLQSIIQANDQADVLLLTATPINLGVSDLFALIDLFFFGDRIFRFEVQELKDAYNDAKLELRKLRNDDMSQEFLHNIRRIQRELSLKITWRMIQENFSKDLERIGGRSSKYEEPEVTEVLFTYPQSYKDSIFGRIIDFLQMLHYEPAKLGDGQEYQSDKSFVWLLKWQLYKRLESSLYAFYRSLQNLSIRMNAFKSCIEAGSIDGGLSLEAFDDSDDIDDRDLLDEERINLAIRTFNTLDSELKDQVMSNMQEDVSLISNMLEELEQVLGERQEKEYDGDTKVKKLRELLKDNLLEGRPTIVFSEWEDTVRYLYSALYADFDKIDYIYGRSGRSKEEIVKRFERGDIDILITTDVLSEGVNLPRAGAVVNFDLPYNPVILVQRAGRALRITNPKKLFLYNFRPEADIDRELALYVKLDLRLQTILDVAGLDFVVWMMDEKNINQLHERERVRYLEFYKEYRERIARSNPDDLIYDTMPEEHKIDRALRHAIKKYGISLELVDSMSSTIGKPIYTKLRGESDLFIIGKVGDRVRQVGEIQDSVEPRHSLHDEAGLDAEKLSMLDTMISQSSEALQRERASLTSLSRKENTLKRAIQNFRARLSYRQMREVLDNLLTLIETRALPLEQLTRVSTKIENLGDYPDIFDDFDAEISATEDWAEIEKISRSRLVDLQFRLMAFIDYDED